jgi:hypothetical protein
MPPIKKPTLADLSDEDRAALRAELDAEQLADITAKISDVERGAAAKLRAFAALMDPRDHLRNCPAEDGTGRFEYYAETKPAQPQKALPAQPVTVIRCIECGGSTVLERSYPVVLAEIEGALLDEVEAA